MNFDIKKRTILYVRHGSHAYGLNTPTSDEDFKGICIKPKEAYFGFTQRFEQHEHMGSKADGVDEVIYSLEKFAALAADANPNIIEVLHVADKDVLKIDEFGEELRAHRNEFLSKKAKFTFSGYAHAQLKRIKTHRAWLLNPPKAPPTRKEFGLSETSKVSKSELGAFDAAVGAGVDVSSLSTYVTDEGFIDRLGRAFRYAFGRTVLPKDAVTLFTREKQYQAAKTHYDQYLNWLKTRNPARAETERKFGYDVKHGMHLERLQTMGVEILRDHTVYVDRTNIDQEPLMKIRRGEVEYDALIQRSELLEAEANRLYAISTLRKEPDRPRLDALIIKLTEKYLRLHG